MKSSDSVPLAFLSPGEGGVISEIRGLRHRGGAFRPPVRPAHGRRRRERHLLTEEGGHRFEHHLKYIGLSPGQQVKVVSSSPGKSMIVAVGDSRISIGKGVAFRVMVRPDDGGDSRG